MLMPQTIQLQWVAINTLLSFINKPGIGMNHAYILGLTRTDRESH
jgi:hypothetical protein